MNGAQNLNIQVLGIAVIVANKEYNSKKEKQTLITHMANFRPK
jgi:hypothetical protein